MAEPWRIELFGGLRACRGDREVSRFRTQKIAELLAYLACFRPRTHPREVLIDLLWPEDDLVAGRHSLSTALSSLRSALAASDTAPQDAILITDRDTVRMNARCLTTDLVAFEAAIRSA